MVAALTVIGGLLWWWEKTLPEGRRRLMQDQLEHDKATIGQTLLNAAQDGTLTEEEIRTADKSGRWTVKRDTHEIRVSTRLVNPDHELQCWSFVLSLPLGTAPTLRTIQDDEGCPPLRTEASPSSPLPPG
ncbi:hypothetical protein ABZ766_13410 [Streptomyces sp. NPDC006670]|uniref:hypothetical protein n=1 Tax=Streptomyces sp. NPDC006670 TaxID=3154476 RepID=UPI0034009A6D